MKIERLNWNDYKSITLSERLLELYNTLNVVIQTVNTLTEAPKPPQEESNEEATYATSERKMAEIIAKREAEIRADERAIIVENIKEWVGEHEYCSGCSISKKSCAKWGESPSAINVESLINYLTSLK